MSPYNHNVLMCNITLWHIVKHTTVVLYHVHGVQPQ